MSRSNFYTGRLAADGDALNGLLFNGTRTGIGPSAFSIGPDGKQDALALCRMKMSFLLSRFRKKLQILFIDAPFFMRFYG